MKQLLTVSILTKIILKNVTNDSSEKHESIHRLVEILSSAPSSMGRSLRKKG